MEPSSNNGHINISIKNNKDRLIITVEDDGVGIEKIKLNRLREMLTFKERDFDEIGINNVNKRMSYYYNHFYNINIYSFKEKGTKVNIIIEDWYKYV
ncbi:ATP-binding protein [Clostridium novyi]|uniref:ATP-binding protein n=1 Tax=Clostridium novyi TaxID=1542 RepID=UPI0009B8F63A